VGPAVNESEGERYVYEGARVYLHVVYHGDERVVHIDVDHPDLNEILQPKEASYAGGKEGGVYIGLRSKQVERAESYLKDRVPE
jgi:hypothetical protein